MSASLVQTSTVPAASATAVDAGGGFSTRIAGLDGLRALAVGLVLAYHLFPAAAPGGFVGVDVFFVISGFLITTLLLREQTATGRIRLGAFWLRRARRLLPALGIVVGVCATAAAIVGGDVLVGIGAQLFGALTFSSNWVSIAGSSDYFAASTPQLFENLWSLAVEEQFYLVWPLLLLVVLKVGPQLRVAAVTLAAAASAGWMAVLILEGGDTTRAYFGTDSHAFGPLIGVALALGLERWRDRPSPWMPSPPGAGVASGTGAVAALLVAAALPASSTIGTFPGTLLAAGLATALVIRVSVTEPAFGHLLDSQPLRWIGQRSYGLYLWHWPIAVLFAAGDPDVRLEPWVASIVLMLTIVAAELSYRFVETPVRQLGFSGAVRVLRSSLRQPGHRRARSFAAMVAALGLMIGSGAAIVRAPAQSSAEELIAIGAAAIEQADELPPVLPDPPPRVRHEYLIDPRPVDGRRITALGDSVMLASATSLQRAMPGIAIDAEVSRSMWVAPSLVKSLVVTNRLRRFVVISLNTNGQVALDPLRDAVRLAGPDRLIVLVTAYGDRTWIPPGNRVVRDFAARHVNVRIADWSNAIDGHGDLLSADGIHPGPQGGDIYARIVKREVAAFETELAGTRTAVRVSRMAKKAVAAATRP